MIKKKIIMTALVLTMCASAAFLSSCTSGTGNNTPENTTSTTETAKKEPVTDDSMMDEVESRLMDGDNGTFSKNNHRIVAPGK